MQISNTIEVFINSLLERENGTVDFTLGELAEKIGCVPSQINYVIHTRFTKERGYSVESRRGGGGFIRITKVRCSDGGPLMHIVNNLGDSLDYPSARAIIVNLFDSGLISEREAKIILSAAADSSYPFPSEVRNTVRCSVIKNILIKLI